MPYIDEETKKKLLDLPVEEVAEALGIKVKRHQALCFMHDDHHPSLAFNTSSNRWKCYVCNVWGNSIDLVQRYHNLSFVDACQWLADHFNILIDGKTAICPQTYQRPKPTPKPVVTHEIDHEVLQALVDNLQITERAAKFLYEDRKYKSEIIERLHICSAETSEDILNVLLTNFSEERILKSGLAWKYKDQWYSYFNAPCLFFPYYDRRGELQTLQARFLGNPEEHQRFQFPKGSVTTVFNLSGINYLREDDPIFISEGVTDCIALLSSGKKAVAIPSATALKPADLEEIIKHPLAMFPDQDDPGQKLFDSLKDLVDSKQGYIHKINLPEDCKDYSVLYCKMQEPDLVNSSLFRRLKKVRYEIAERAGLPAYRIAQNRTLIEMIEQRPATLDALRYIFGMGAKTIDKYGNEFLSVLISNMK